jgi:uncharacterized protein (TIGR01777 family)
MANQHCLIAGGSGFIGSKLALTLKSLGYQVHILSRSSSNPLYQWNPSRLQMNADALKGVSLLINLAGENVGSGRWSAKRKQELLQSRISSVETLAAALQFAENPPFMVGASAIGYYGNQKEHLWLNEHSGPGDDFLAKLTCAWEQGYAKLEHLCSGLAIVRIGVVLDSANGALPKMLMPIRYGAGMVPGSGKQGISWIHIQDVVNAFVFLSKLQKPGIYNLTAPEPATIATLMQISATLLKRPLWPFHVPSALLRILLGEMADLVLEGNFIQPANLLNEGFEFEYKELAPALQNLLLNKKARD